MVPIFIPASMHSSRKTLWTCLSISAAIHGFTILCTPQGSTTTAERNFPTIRMTAVQVQIHGIVASKPSVEPTHRPRAIQRANEDAAIGLPSPSPVTSTPETVYCPPDEVDEKASAPPIPDDMPMPSPELASGHLIIKLFISQNGSPELTEILESTLPKDYTDRLIEQIMTLTFIPAKKSGATVASWKVMEFFYESQPPH